MTDVVIVAATRTAIGSFGGSLAGIQATDLGALVIRALMEKTGIAGEEVNEVLMGQVLTAGAGQIRTALDLINRPVSGTLFVVILMVMGFIIWTSIRNRRNHFQ